MVLFFLLSLGLAVVYAYVTGHTDGYNQALHDVAMNKVVKVKK